MGKDQVKIKRWRKITAFTAALLVTAAVVTVLFYYINHNSRESSLNEASSSAEITARYFSFYFDKQWDRLDFVINNIKRYDFETSEAAAEYLSTLSSDMNNRFSYLYLICDNRFFRGSDGKEGWWNISEFDDLTKEKQTIYKKIFSDESAKLVLIKKLETPVSFSNSTGKEKEITHIAVVCNVSSLTGALSYSSAENLSEIAFYFANADFVSTNYFRSTFLTNNAFLSSLSELPFDDPKSFEKITDAISKNDDGTALFTDSGNQYVLTYEPLFEDGWYLFTVIPLGSLSTDIGTPITFVSVLSIIVILFVFVILIQYVRMNSLKNAAAQKQLSEAKTAAFTEKSDFLNNMSHDIRTPLDNINGMAEMAKDSSNNQTIVNDCCNSISKNALQLMNIVNDSLEFSSLESGKTVIAHEPVNLSNIVSESMESINSIISKRRINIEYPGYPDEPANVFGDANRLRQLITTLLRNGVSFTPDGGYIRLESAVTHDKSQNIVIASLSVADSGAGLDEEALSRLFVPFNKNNRFSKESEQLDTGLELPIVKKLTEAMGGTIEIESIPDVGSKFTITIPFEINLNPSAAEEKEIVEIEEENPDYSNLYALFAEDNAMNREISLYFFNKYNLRVDVAEDGKIALEKFKNSPPGKYDLILMDILMPNMDGYEATRAIRALDRPDAKKIPIIAMTANTFDDDVAEAFNAGMDEHLAKPIDQKLLIKIINRIQAQVTGL